MAIFKIFITDVVKQIIFYVMSIFYLKIYTFNLKYQIRDQKSQNIKLKQKFYFTIYSK